LPLGEEPFPKMKVHTPCFFRRRLGRNWPSPVMLRRTLQWSSHRPICVFAPFSTASSSEWGARVPCYRLSFIPQVRSYSFFTSSTFHQPLPRICPSFLEVCYFEACPNFPNSTFFFLRELGVDIGFKISPSPSGPRLPSPSFFCYQMDPLRASAEKHG